GMVYGCGDDPVPAGPPGGTSSETSGITGNGTTTNTSTTSTNNSTTSTDTTATTSTTSTTTTTSGMGVFGAPCASDEGCRERLVCELGRCTASGTQKLGEICELTAECDLELYCDDSGLCQASGDQDPGTLCMDTSECRSGVICSAQTLLGQCELAGMLDLGAPCAATAECLAGLVCVPEPNAEGSVCTVQRDAKPAPFTGKTCLDEDGVEPPARVYFEVPEETDEAEFYRLPFPNDIRLDGGRPDLGGFTVPGPNIEGVDLVAETLSAVEASQEGYGLTQGVFMRFSTPVDFATLDARGDGASVQLVDITPGSPEYGLRQPLRWEASTGRGKFICHQWVNIRPSPGRPLSPETTYAVLLTRDVLSAEGEPLMREPDFEALLDEAQPGEARLVQAWEAYAPLRAWLEDQGRSPDTLLVAAVFTTGDPTALSGKLRDAVYAAEPPTVAELTACTDDANVVSPCDDGLEGEAHVRGCFGRGDQPYVEVQGLLEVPVFQKGEPPYVEDGAIAVDVMGQPLVQRTEQVCLSMTLPDFEDMPTRGWAVLLVPHGLGGSYRDHVDAFAPLVSALTAGGNTNRMITLSWDQVVHAARRGDSTLSPERLMLNYNNPQATVGHVMQATADIYAVLRWLEDFSIPAEQSPTGRAVRANTNFVFILGHDLGGVSATMATPFEPKVRGLLLAGTGGQLYRLLDASEPAQMRVLLEDAVQDSNLSEVHPFVQLMQGYYDSIDPAVYAEQITIRPPEGMSPRHVLFMMGQNDNVSPQLSLETMATALRLVMTEPLLQPFALNAIEQMAPPVAGNLTIDGTATTVVGRQYAPEFYSGHDVVFRNVEAREDMIRFLSTYLRYGLPTVD
ncbi:MAG: hypothetical protein AAFX99_10855, partial [Myxococcota bacterium]